MRRIMAVADYIFKQSFRNRILNILIIFAVFSIGFSLLISELAQEVEIRMITDFGLFSIAVFAFLTIALSITVQMFEETELKTISLIMVKPIKRWEYITGKFIGISLTVFLNIFLMLFTLLIIIKLKGGDPWNLRIFLSVGFTMLSSLILVSVALVLSVIATSVPGCVIFLFFVYVLGHLTVHLKNIVKSIDNQAVKTAVDVIYYLVPNLELFNLKDKIYSLETGVFAPPYLAAAVLYSFFYTAIMLYIASLIMDKKEF